MVDASIGQWLIDTSPWAQWGLMALLGYLLGSVSGSLLLGKFKAIDIRTSGSGNAGGTNAFRTLGWRFALAVVVIDIGKGALAAGLLPGLFAQMGSTQAFTTLAPIAGFAAILGHIWPVYFGFRGGKGAGTAVGAVAVIAPGSILPMFIIWLITVLATGYVGLATIFAGLILVPTMWWFGPTPLPASLASFAILTAALIVFAHRSNITRLLNGTENRFNTQKIWRRR
ncbi:MAG TPA: glycerol-3-phosphate 1-O-acyltransferase PlsY [Wenzhouxiangella sp.]